MNGILHFAGDEVLDRAEIGVACVQSNYRSAAKKSSRPCPYQSSAMARRYQKRRSDWRSKY
jgi:hypothetical protein